MRPYKVTPEARQMWMDKFANYLDNLTMTTGELNFKGNVLDEKNDNKVMVTFSMKAWIKMRDLVDRYSSEVGWYGFIDKISDMEYVVTDICVYSQLVTGDTVKEDNRPWDKDMPISEIRRRHFHGHSHVNMQVTPSGTDIKHRDDLVYMCKSDSFFFFMITNKSMNWSAQLFDLANNMVYNTDDILIDVDLGDGEMLTDFVDDTKKMIVTQTAANLTAMKNERSGVSSSAASNTPIIQTTTNGSGQSAWLPKTSPETKVATSEKKGKGKGKKFKASKQYDLFETWTEEDWENYAAQNGDYYDDIMGYVSDCPPPYMMR